MKNIVQIILIVVCVGLAGFAIHKYSFNSVNSIIDKTISYSYACVERGLEEQECVDFFHQID